MRRIASCIAVVVMLSFGAVARGDTPPWAVGVSDAQKAKAQQLLDAGNQAFLDKSYAAALDNYKAAIAQWDHPAIRFNIVRCLIQLDRLVEASDELELALKYGAAPLEERVYSEAQNYQKLLAKEIGTVEVSCAQDGVALTLDGQPLAKCPAHETRRVVPGPHQIVGTKHGLTPRTVELVVIGGRKQDVAVSLDPLGAGGRIERRWPQYVPWAVFAGGFALAGVGGLFDLAAASDRDSYDLVVKQRCALSTCTPDQLSDVAGKKDSAAWKSAVGTTVLITGAAAVATGGVLLYLNRGRTVYPAEQLVPAVAPLPGGGAAITVGGRF